MLAFVFATLLSSAAAIRCGTTPDSPRRARMEAKFRAAKAAKSHIRLTSRTLPPVVPVYFHVVYNDTSYAGGYVPQAHIDDQIDVLNNNYSSVGVTFELANVSYVENPTWFATASYYNNASQYDMKSTLRQGDASALNIYTVSLKGTGGLIGYSTFPVEYTDLPLNDGVVVLFKTLPGGTASPYNLGQNVVHEVGHWFGLYHTFEGGCAETAGGDLVADTPAEATYYFGCPNVVVDSCANATGVDSIHNYMSYYDDVCMTEFTADQALRAQDQTSIYRGLTF